MYQWIVNADLHSTSQHVKDEAGPLSAPVSVVKGRQHGVQHAPKVEQMPFHPSAMHRLMLHRGTCYVGKRQSLCRTSAFQLSDMDMSIRDSMQLQ